MQAGLTVLIVSFSPLYSCKQEPVYIEELDTVCFDSQVLPILQTSCAISGCHDAGSASEGFISTNYESITQAVNPGDANGSLLYQVITDINGESMMPPDGPLSKEQRMLIHIWIAQGALNTLCGSVINPPTDTITSDTLCFVQDILPVLLSNCGTIGCHDATSHTDGYILISYNTLMLQDESIIPYNPAESEIYEAITETDDDDRMPPPPRSPLSLEQKEILRKWITAGAFNSDCPQSACDTVTVISFSNTVNPVIQTNCVGCHNDSQSNGGVNLNGYQQVKYYAETLRNNKSMLTGTIRKLTGFAAMPPTGSLSACSIRQIELWIEQGKQSN